MSLRDDLLPRCAVRVHVRGVQVGTGFFIGGGLVVTCAHVVLPQGPETPTNPADLTLRDNEDRPHTVEAIENIWPEEDVDLAVLQIRSETEPLAALLDTQIRDEMRMQTYGYTEKYPRGVPTTFDSEGTMGGNGWLKVKNGQVQPGMSGAPVLDVETGTVCGVLKRSRDPAQPLGGYVVPISTLVRLLATVTAENERFHLTTSTWLDEMTSEQRQRWLASRTKAASLAPPARHLMLTLGPDRDDWKVTATIQPGDEKIDAVTVDFTTVREKVARIFRDWSVRGRWPEGEQIRLLGSILAGALFPGAIGARVREILDQSDQRLLVWLYFQEGTEPDLVHLPWEHLYLPESADRGDVAIATDSRVGFARVLSPEPRLDQAPPTGSQLSALLVGARRDSVDDAETTPLTLLRRSLAQFAQSGLHPQPLDNPRPSALANEILATKYDVIHYVGYGCFTDGIDRIGLGGDTDSGMEYVTIDPLKNALTKNPPKLLVLQLCSSQERAIPADFSMLAPSLVKLGIPAVVAYQYPLAPDIAGSFNEAMYGALLVGKSLDVAVQEGRYQLTFHARTPRGPVSPALFLRYAGELRLVREGGTSRTPDVVRRSQVMSIR